MRQYTTLSKKLDKEKKKLEIHLAKNPQNEELDAFNTDLDLELKIHKKIDESHQDYVKTSKINPFLRNLVSIYKDHFDHDLADQVAFEDEEEDPIDEEDIDIVEDPPMKISQKPPRPVHSDRVSYGENRKDSERDRDRASNQRPSSSNKRDSDHIREIDGYSGIKQQDQSKDAMDLAGILGLKQSDDYSKRHNEDIDKLHYLEDEYRDAEMRKMMIQEDHAREIEERADRLRRDRASRQRQEEALMEEREKQIQQLVKSAATKSRLTLNDVQSYNKSTFAQVKDREFDVKMESKRVEMVASRIKAMVMDIEDEEKYIEDIYREKEDLVGLNENLDSKYREMEREKEALESELEKKREELRTIRITGAGFMDKGSNEDVEREIRTTDNLMVVRMQELKRERIKFEGLKRQYEEYLVGEERKNQEKKKDPDMSSQLRSNLHFDDHASRIYQSGIESSQLKMGQNGGSRFRSELKDGAGSRFLDEFNRDIEKLIYRD